MRRRVDRLIALAGSDSVKHPGTDRFEHGTDPSALCDARTRTHDLRSSSGMVSRSGNWDTCDTMLNFDTIADVTPIGTGQPIKRHTSCAGLINEYQSAA